MRDTIPKVSVIVPIFNAGDRLTACLDTLVNQTLSDIEIILILDCPTDGSEIIAKKYAQIYNQIIVLENDTNLHIGNSRNRGFEVAKGEYIGFSDHDDYRELTMYEELYKCAVREDADVLLGTSTIVGEYEEIMHFPSFLQSDTLREHVLIDLIQGGDDISLTPTATNIHPNLYKSEFLRKHKILFVDTLIYTPEDRIFQIMCLHHAKTVCLNTSQLYFHVIHCKSAAHTLHYTSNNSRAMGKMKLYDFFKLNNCYEQYESYFLIAVKKELTNSLINEFLSTKSISQFIKNIIFLKSLPFCKKAYQSTSYSVDKYRFGGKLIRKMIWLLMKI
jgi:glycosyltransferase involved in cell wall biosynthesis